jgi:long-subunit fatty acid transport protein
VQPRRLPLSALFLVAALAPGAVRAGPLDDPHVGGIGFGGPTTGDLTAVFWNPAALGIMQGIQIAFAASQQVGSVSVQRASIDASGAPGPGRSFPAVRGSSTSAAPWPFQPGSFLAVGAAVGNRFTLALATYTPFAQRISYAPTADNQEPTRYHVIEADLRNVAMVSALALRIGNEIRVGVAPGFLLSTGSLTFDEDTALPGGPSGVACDGVACGVENPAAAARYSVGSGLGLLDSRISFTVGGGLHFRRGAFEAGLAYASHPLGNDGEVIIDGPRSSVSRPPRLGPPSSICPADRPYPCAFARIGYGLPDVFTAGVTFHFSDRLALTGILRWLTFSRHESIAIRVVAPPNGGLRDSGLPQQILLYRGFHDVIEARVRVEREVFSFLRAGVALRADNGSVSASNLSPAAVGGPSFEPSAMLEVSARSWLRLTAGYALTVTPAQDTGTSAFDPRAAAACADTGGDLASDLCSKRLTGAARPTAAGRYSAVQQTASLNITFRF